VVEAYASLALEIWWRPSMTRPDCVNGIPHQGTCRTNHVEQRSNNVRVLQGGICNMNVSLDISQRLVKTL
jgi:hypothetical protein